MSELPTWADGPGTAVDPEAVAANLAGVRERIRAAGGDPSAVRVVAVTKGFGPAAARAALGAGLRELGENYAVELLGKAHALAEEPTGPTGPAPAWHFIGRLQRNKVKALAEAVSCWQSVDRPEVADEIARRAPGARVLVQVAAWGEARKGGCAPGAVPALVERCSALGLAVEGLMAVAPMGGGDRAEAGFAEVRGLVDHLGLATCSVGMTDDLSEAVRAGSTMVRIGRALFGPRPPRSDVQS